MRAGVVKHCSGHDKLGTFLKQAVGEVMHVSVVIPIYNALLRAQDCLESIFTAGSSLKFEAIAVDNGSAPEVEAWLRNEERKYANLKHLRYSEPLGYAKAVNAGAAVASGEVLILVNSDTIITPGCLDGLYDALCADSWLGAITPFTNKAGEPAQMDYRTVDLPASRALALVAENPRPFHILHLPQRITFFCVALRRPVWLDFGGLDESFGAGNFEDDDLCLRLRVAGYRLGVAQHLFVYHHDRATFQANSLNHHKWMTQNAGLFATRARQFGEAAEPAKLRHAKRSAQDVSVVIQQRLNGNLARTLQSLDNQTVRDFEVVSPGNGAAPTRTWIAYITEGDLLYPFHLEALRDALERTSSEAVFSDAWITCHTEHASHPDAGRLYGQSAAVAASAPALLSGWMHHASLDPARLWDQTVPIHWPRLTWETGNSPIPAARGEADPGGVRRLVPIEFARSIYRRSVPLEKRLTINRHLRRVLGLNAADGRQLHECTKTLPPFAAGSADAGPFEARGHLPSVFLFSIIPWHFAFQRPHHFATGLARLGHPVFWVETDLFPIRSWWNGKPFRQAIPGLYLVHLPAPARNIYTVPWDDATSEAMSAALGQIASAYGVREAVSLVNYPRWEPLALRAKRERGWKIIYDCLDDQRAFADLFQTKLQNHEERLIDAADLMTTSSSVLLERFQRRRPGLLLQNACDYGLFSSAAPAGRMPNLPRPIIMFAGALADWLDMDLIQSAATHFPDWSFVYIGPMSFSDSRAEASWLRSTNLPNISVLPQVDPPTLASYVAECDVCIMPFLDIPITRTMNAVKLYEYLAAGKPVVTRDLPEVRHLCAQGAAELIASYSSSREFMKKLQAAVNEPPESGTRRREFARQHDWFGRVERLSSEILRLYCAE